MRAIFLREKCQHRVQVLYSFFFFFYQPFTLSMMTSNGTSRLMTTWTGAIWNRLNACDLVRGKPSSSQLRSADDKWFNSPPMIFSISSSGTSWPFDTNLKRSQFFQFIYVVFLAAMVIYIFRCFCSLIRYIFVLISSYVPENGTS